jgi:serine/threonine protein kinase
MVAHRDIKAENVLLDAHWNIRLIDFGLSHAFTENNPLLHTACGSPAYAAPEMIIGDSYSKAADIWSAGILLFAMVAGELPFDDPGGVHGILMKIVSEDPVYPDVMSSSLIDLLKRILTKSPDQRIDIARIKAHPWFSHSEYLQIFQLPFSNEEWLVRGVDRSIVEAMERMGIDVKSVAAAVLCGEYTTETAIYSMLRRLKIAKRIHEVMESLIQGTVAVTECSSFLSATAADRGPLVRGVTRPVGRRRETSIISHRRGSIDIAQLPSALASPPHPTIVRPKPTDCVRRPRSGTLQ